MGTSPQCHYLGCISSVDDNVGRLLDYLDESGLADNTMVIYTSDQGFYLGEHGWFDKRFIYNESFKTPLLIRWPNKIRPGITNDEMVQNLDFAQTFLDAATIKAPNDMQGESLLPLLFEDQKKWTREAVYYHYYEFPSVHMVKRHYGENKLYTSCSSVVFCFGSRLFFSCVSTQFESHILPPNF